MSLITEVTLATCTCVIRLVSFAKFACSGIDERETQTLGLSCVNPLTSFDIL